MKLAQIVEALDAIAPVRDAASWDNVGLLVGDPGAEIARAIVAIDLTRAVADEARAKTCDLVIAYHPPIFEGLKRVVAGTIAFDAIRAGTAIYSPHTALDVAAGGTNDVLADAVGMTERAPLRSEAKDAEYKLVFFAPASDVEKVCRAMFDAGAGRIGAYSSCSFRSAGTGTFFGGEGTNPTVGAAGKLETVEELRVEMVVPIAKLDAVVRALRATHSYEEPAFDVVRLAAAPRGGMGRVGAVSGTRAEIVERVKRALGATHVLVAGPLDGRASRAAVCAGSCGDLVVDATRARADVYVTGEMRHHDALRAAETGMTVVCALHSVSERATLPRYAKRIRDATGVEVIVSTTDADPFRFV